ncbi:hypothetical protein DL766_001491 [Monosporascus sp. MC13-8B]|uniref:Chitin synthase n=1 Tax=Monosporascus cannonballus TaxID=155416 RepID=A0ABY0H5W7_9PEZI|nr:hypothetical protein DL762_006261 [Monosporascus cannonballus]RYO99828.1 hypothetical protein DL763_001218 [Monosporascus cannonballus]RYP37497.1 hypothetical protein DL766_001491 [Monosporascus sp. MC13-8B]
MAEYPYCRQDGSTSSPLLDRTTESYDTPNENGEYRIQLQLPDRAPPPPHGLGRPMARNVDTTGFVQSFEYPVPIPIRNAVQAQYLGSSMNNEFTKLRYTAATCDADDFTLKNGYDLRARAYSRCTELLVCVTYFNEDKVLFCRTYHSVMKNIRNIANLGHRSVFNRGGGPAWQKIVLCLVMDGFDACDKRVLDVLATCGAYQDGVMKEDVDGRATVAHIFEYTTQLAIEEGQQLIRPRSDHPSTLQPMQVLVCLKAKNSGKINSNRWTYNAFGRILNPEIVVHIDTGTRIHGESLYNLWRAFKNERNLGGACGILKPYAGTGLLNLLNPLVGAQDFEYKIACQMERALESTTGYLSVLPGAFSAYRQVCRFPNSISGRPLQQYFIGDPTLEKSSAKPAAPASLIRLNRYLADDRILSFELTVKTGHEWRTRMVTSAVGVTDAPISAVDFINQRRRWLNGSLSASVYSMRMFHRLFKTAHNPVRKLLLLIQMVYNVVYFVLSWFSFAAFLLATFIVNDIAGDPPPDAPVEGFPFGSGTPIFNAILQIIYLATVALQFILALGGRAKSHALAYTISFTVFVVVQMYMLMNLIYLTKRLVDFKMDTNGGSSYNYITEYYTDVGPITVMVTAVSAFGFYIAAGILYLDPWHLFHSWVQYLFISSTYTNILKTYAFSNINDVSWGNKSGKKVVHKTPPPPPLPSIVLPEPKEQPAAGDREQERLQEDIDHLFEMTVKRALYPPVKEEPPVSDREDTFERFRTSLVAGYLFSNFLVCLIVMNDSLKQFWWFGDPYWHKIWFFRIWMWGNSAVLIMQFVGCLYQRAADIFRFLFYTP